MGLFNWFKKKEYIDTSEPPILEDKKENVCASCGMNIDETVHKQTASGGKHFHIQCFRELKKEAAKQL